jgi:hypothetical protein
MSLSTKDVSAGGNSGPSKLIEPGNIMASISKIELDQPSFLVKDQGYYLVLHMEGPDLGEEFEGFFIDKDNESLGRHKGQVGRVKYSKWPFKDGETKSGIVINRDNEIMKAIKQLGIRLGEDVDNWFISQDDKFETIEELITAINECGLYFGKPMNYCIAARQYMKQNGYTGNDCYLPKYKRDALPYEEITASPSKLAKFDEATHVEAPQPVNSFSGDDEMSSGAAPAPTGGGNFDI